MDTHSYSGVQQRKTMEKTVKISLWALTMLLSSFVYAGGSTNYGEITELYVNNNWTMVRVQGVTANPDSCSGSGYYALNPADKNYEILHSTLLTAQIAGRKVKFYLSGCSGQSQKYPHIISVWLN